MDVSALTNNDDDVQTEQQKQPQNEAQSQPQEHHSFSIGSMINNESPEKQENIIPEAKVDNNEAETNTKPTEEEPQGKDLDIETDITLSDDEASKLQTEDDVADFEISDDEEDNLQNGTKADCQWSGCEENFPNTDDLVQHLNSQHIGQPGVEYICEWNDCLKNGIQQPSRLALISHIRTHTGEKQFFCILPECSEYFHTADTLSQHIKIAHKASGTSIDYPFWYRYLKEVKENNNFSSKYGLLNEMNTLERYSKISDTIEFEKALASKFVNFEDVHNVEFVDLIEPTPKRQKTSLNDINSQLKSDYEKADKEFRQHVSSLAKDTFIKQDQVEKLPTDEEIESVETLDELKSLYESLKRKYTWGLEVEQLITKDLVSSKQDHENQWSKNQLLLDAHIELEVQENQSLYQLK